MGVVSQQQQQNKRPVADLGWPVAVIGVYLSIMRGQWTDEHKQSYDPFSTVSIYFPLAATAVYVTGLVLGLSCRWKAVSEEKLRPFMATYNIYQVLLNAWWVYACINEVYARGMPLWQSTVDRTPSGFQMGLLMWLHMHNRAVEMLDTLFMMLRKRHHTITILHLYRHTVLLWVWFVVCKYACGGEAYFGALINSIVHVPMYGYYFLKSIGVECPWKQRLTQFQMAQFVVCFTQAVVVFYRGVYPRNLTAIQMTVMASLFFLFREYYQKEYRAQTRRELPPKMDPAMNRFSTRRFKEDNAGQPDYDAVVIGSGIGGSTCASLLAQQGQRVLVLEQHDRTGGCTHTFTLSRTTANTTDADGKPLKGLCTEGVSEMASTECEFDTGTHYVSSDMSSTTARAGAVMRAVTGGGVQWRDLGSPWDLVVYPEDHHVATGAPNNMDYYWNKGCDAIVESLVKSINPGDAELEKRISAFMKVCRDCGESFSNVFVARLLPRRLEAALPSLTTPFYLYGSLTTARVLNAMIRLGWTEEQVLQAAARGGDAALPEPPKEVDLTDDREKIYRRAMGVLVHPIGDYACQPRDSAMLAHGVTCAYYQDGASYTVGPTQNISRHAARQVMERGGNVYVNATVDAIDIDDSGAVKGVRMHRTNDKSKEAVTIPCKKVVCATSVYNLYGSLLKEAKHPKVLEECTAFQKREFEPSYGHAYLFVALKGSPEEIGVSKTNMWYINGYDTDRHFDEYFADYQSVRPPTVYVGFPCTKDITWNERYPGFSNAIMISDAKWSMFEPWAHLTPQQRDKNPEYQKLKSDMTHILLEIMYEKVPGTFGNVLFAELGTPLSDAQWLATFQGGSYGTRCNPQYFSPKASRFLMNPKTAIEGLYVAGCDAWAPAVAGSMYGGFLSACKVTGYVGTFKIFGAIMSDVASQIREKDKDLPVLAAYYRAFKKFVYAAEEGEEAQ